MDRREEISIISSPTTRRTLIKAGGAVIGGVMFGGALAACGDDDDDSQASGSGSKETEKVDFQIRWLLEVSFAGWYAGIEFGWFEEEGIDLNIIPGGPNLDVQQVIAGDGAPIGEGIMDGIVRGRIEQNIPFKIFGALYQRTPAVFMSFAEKGWTEPADLVGKRIATTAAGRPIVNALLKSAGLPEEDWKYVPSGFDPTPLINDQADFFQGFRTGQGVTLGLDGYDMSYITYDQFNYDPYDAPVFALEKELQENEDLLVRFLRGSIKGWEWATANPDGAAKMTVDKYGRDDLTLKQQAAEGKAQVSDVVTDVTDEHGLFYMEPGRWDNTMKFLQSAGAISKTVPATDIMTADIQARAMDGKTKLLSEQELKRAFT